MMYRLYGAATPGPWEFKQWDDAEHDMAGFSITAGGHLLPLDSATGDIDEAEANARLIAAAPLLLAALREIADGCVSYRPGHVNYESNRTKEQIRAIADAAIAAAEGKP